MKSTHILLATALLTILITMSFFALRSAPELHMNEILRLQDTYSTQVQPFFDSKCVACHSCYNSPCQLNLSSFEGLERGANKINVYDFPAVEDRSPTRLYQDAHSFPEWQKHGFYSVLRKPKEPLSILELMVKGLPGIESGQQSAYNSEESRVCVAKLDGEVDKYKKENPAGRMPYGFPKADDSETENLEKWLNSNSQPVNLTEMEARVLEHKSFQPQVRKWEKYFNQSDMKAQLSSRYIYEHLFLAHIYFEGQPNVFFRLVRSQTENGPVREIATPYPFDNPGKKFFYRLRPITNTLTHKDHIPFLFSNKKLQTYKKEFNESDWLHLPEKMPAYGRAGGNPFETFKDIPVKARYRFFLEEAGYHVMTFIKGPVCRGQTALNVINDHFWVMFIDPEQDPMAKDPLLEKKIAKNFAFPSQAKDDITLSADFRDRYWQSLKLKNDDLIKKKKSFSEKDLWNGDKKNTNALLTIYRHFDSAHVLRGVRGQTPRTVWVMDYQIFESIYYNLTAGYNVFGAVLHQVNSRLFMEMNRLAAEDLFISFLPKEDRLKTRASWNREVPEKKESLSKAAVDLFLGDVKDKLRYEYPYWGKAIASDVDLKDSKDPKTAFLDILFQEHFSTEQLNRDQDFKGDLKKLASLLPKNIRFLPDTILMRVEDTDEVYSLIHNKEHYNVSMMFLEADRRAPSEDTLDAISGVATSYANLFMVIQSKDLAQFIQDLSQVESEKTNWEFLKKYAVSRSDEKFWSHHLWFSQKSMDKKTNESGIIDLNRYLNL